MRRPTPVRNTMPTCDSSLTQSDTEREEAVLLNVEKEEMLILSSSCLPFS